MTFEKDFNSAVVSAADDEGLTIQVVGKMGQDEVSINRVRILENKFAG